jgi:hypothetical protein
MASSIGSRDSVSFLLTIQATGFLTFTLVGLPPTEYASLRWTHQHAGLSRRTTYYSARLFPGFFAGFDLQHISNPAYNQQEGLAACLQTIRVRGLS